MLKLILSGTMIADLLKDRLNNLKVVFQKIFYHGATIVYRVTFLFLKYLTFD